ncbi:MAG: cysteine desulfurase [Spirochaetaceae bacterium]|jgi:cysteine desulfurase|nr:cysteine desulfurase [Spirochaetaceae bacterium]
MTGAISSGGYFDWAATAIPDADIIAESTEIALGAFGNPSSIHRAGKFAREKLEEARERAAAACGVPSGTLFFTSGGTESDHLVILSLLRRPAATSIAVSAVEHSAVREMAESMKSRGWQVITIPCDSRGIVTAEAVLGSLENDTALVCVMAVNNETGAVQPIRAIADSLTERFAGKRRPHFHVDCVQTAGKIPLDLGHPGIDSAAVSAHKIGGPRGSGLLYLPRQMEPFVRGGGQERGIRNGTENLAGAWAISRCLERYYLKDTSSKLEDGVKPVPPENALLRYQLQCQLAARFIASLMALEGCTILPACRTAGKPAPGSGDFSLGDFSPWILQASFAGIPGEVMVRALDERGFAISTGSACSFRRKGAFRPILRAMGIDGKTAQNAVRFSFGHRTTETDMDALQGALRELRGQFSAGR